MPISFSVATVENGSTSSRLHPVDRVATPTPTPAQSRVSQVLEDHRPWEMMDNMALIIVDQTYAALREILGPAAAAPPSDDGGHVEVSRPVDPADPDSPLLCVNASARHCCVRLVNSAHGAEYTSPEQKGKPHYRLTRASVSVSPGALHVSLDGGGGVGRAGCWTCADVRPDVAEKGLFGVLDAIRSRLDAAIRIEASLIEMARASGVRGAKTNEVIDARMALEKMRAELDVDAIVRRMRQKRRRQIQEIGCRPDADQEAEVLAKRLRALHVSQKRCRSMAEVDQVDEDDLLTKRLGALQV